jgi:hypothetical protein
MFDDFDDSKTHWYHYALCRLPGSCLMSLVTLSFAAILLWLALAIYGWLAR